MDLPTFLRTYKTRSRNIHWLLGAGTSANAGIMTAWEMTWEFKRDIYCSENGKPHEFCRDLTNPRIRNIIQLYLDSKGTHPQDESLDEYSHYFSLAYRSESDRRSYIEKKISNANIQFSHRVLAALLASDLCKAIWTTNFDTIIEESWQSLGFSMGKLNTASIENSLKASQCLRDDRFPLYVKLHGDFQSTNLKNTKQELQDQNLDFKQALIELVGTKYGFAVAGYSGRDNSIMEVLETIISKANSDYPGIFWFNRTGSTPIPRVQSLIENAQQKGIDAHIIDIPSFDELMLLIYKFFSDELTQFSKQLKPTLDRRSPIELKFSDAYSDVVRLNAFKVLSTPLTAYHFEADIGGISEIKEVLKSSKNMLATRVKEGVIAFGDRDEIAAAFGIDNKSKITAQPFKVDRYKPSELFLLYQVIETIFCKNLPLASVHGFNGLTLYIDPNATDFNSLVHLQQSLKTKWDQEPKLNGKTPGLSNYWSECIQLRLEEKMGSLWLFVSPSVYIEKNPRNWKNPNYLKQEDFRKKRLGGRYNKQFNDILNGWCKCLGLDYASSGKHSITLSAFSKELSVNPLFEISTVSGFSRRGRND